MRVLKGLEDFMNEIPSLVDFVPMPVNFACPQCDTKFKKNNCISDGKYCGTSKNSTKDIGQKVLIEDLRQQCVWREASKSSKTKKNFFKYVTAVQDLCPDGYITKKCSNFGLKAINTDAKTIEECVKSTFYQDGKISFAEDENKFFETSSFLWSQQGAHMYPALSINGMKFQGKVSPENIFEDICQNFDRMPKGCTKFLVKQGVKVTPSGLTDGELFTLVGVLIALNLIVFFIYRRSLQTELKSEMKMQVSSAVSQYVALS